MATTPGDYLAVLKASYDYEPQPDAQDEIAMKEDQLLFLLEKVDDEYVVCACYFPGILILTSLSLLELVEGQGEARVSG